MSSDFDFFEGDFNLDPDLNEELAALEGEIEESAEVTLRTAVLKKNNMVALLCMKSAPQGAAVSRVDPRESVPSVQIYDDPAAALKWFTRSIRSSEKNGWSVVYDGLPLAG